MITPNFKIEQTLNTIIIIIHAPYTNIKNTEIHVLDEDFRFYSAPYYLRLNLPGKVEEGDDSSAIYDVKTLSFIVTLNKTMPNEVFNNLEMLTLLLQPKSEKPKTKPTIEILSSTTSPSDDEDENDVSNEWFVEQSVIGETPSELLLNIHGYGFASKHSGLGNKHEVELSQVAEIENPDSLSISERERLAKEVENQKFSDDHYFQDLMETDLSSILTFKVNFKKFSKFTNTEQNRLQLLKNQEFLLELKEERRALLGAFEIIFSYLLDHRLNEGGTCIESQWNISRISTTLSWFRVFDDVKSVILSCVRRSLAYPLYRHWDISQQTLLDTLKIFSIGPVGILKCFLAVNDLFRKREPYYLLNQLYIDEYCVWMQKVSLTKIDDISKEFDNAIKTLKKAEVGFDLELLEVAAKATLDEEMEVVISDDISSLSLNN